MIQSLDEPLKLATIQKFSIDVVRVEVADSSVAGFAAVLADLRRSPRCLLKQLSVV
jgi:hypothetical protein